MVRDPERQRALPPLRQRERARRADRASCEERGQSRPRRLGRAARAAGAAPRRRDGRDVGSARAAERGPARRRRRGPLRRRPARDLPRRARAARGTRRRTAARTRATSCSARGIARRPGRRPKVACPLHKKSVRSRDGGRPLRSRVSRSRRSRCAWRTARCTCCCRRPIGWRSRSAGATRADAAAAAEGRTREGRCGSDAWSGSCGGAATPAFAQAPQGFRTTPTLGWTHGDHRVDLGLSTRARGEYWKAFSDDDDVFAGIRTKAKLQYAWREQWIATVEGQLVQLHGLDRTASGAAATYRSANDGQHDVWELQLRQANVEWKPIPSLFLRVGRQDVKLGAEVALRGARLALPEDRAARRAPGRHRRLEPRRARVRRRRGRLRLRRRAARRFAARPDDGRLRGEDGYRPLHDIALRRWRRWTGEARDLARRTASSALRSRLRRRPRQRRGRPRRRRRGVHARRPRGSASTRSGPGALDALLWAAGQFGTTTGYDQRAGAGIVELGYQLPKRLREAVAARRA